MVYRPHEDLARTPRWPERFWFGGAALALAVLLVESMRGGLPSYWAGLVLAVLWCLGWGALSRYLRKRAEFRNQYPGWEEQRRTRN